jgi:hypothetical protein
MIARPATIPAEQDDALADYKARGLAALDLSTDVIEACIILELTSLASASAWFRELPPLAILESTSCLLAYSILVAWASSFSTRIGNEVALDRSVVAGVYRRLSSMERRGLVLRLPHRHGRFSRWTLTTAGTDTSRALLSETSVQEVKS